MKLRIGISAKLTLVFVFFAALVLGGLGGLAYNSGRASLEAAARSELLSKALHKETALDNWVDERLGRLKALAETPSLKVNLEAFTLAEPGSSESEAAYQRVVGDLLPRIGPGQPFLEIFILEPHSAMIIASTDPRQEGKFKEVWPYFINGLEGPFVQNVYYSPAQQGAAMTVSAPIRAVDGRVLGVLAGRLDLNEMNAIIQQRSGLRSTDDSFLVNASSLFVTQPRLYLDPAILARGLHTEAVNRCLQHGNGVISADDYRGVPAIIVYRWLSEHEVCLIVKMDQSEALAPVRAFGRTLAIIGGLVLLAASLLAFYIAQAFTSPILALKDTATRFGYGELESRAPEGTNDELGDLAREFNHMADSISEKNARLRNWTEELERTVKQRTADLSASEERYRILAETSPDMIFVIDREDRVTYVNARAARQFGKTPDQVMGKAHRELFPPSIAETQVENLHAVLSSGQPLSTESLVIFPGGRVWLNTQLVPLRNESGEINGVMGVSRDVTEQKQAEEAIKTANQRFSLAVRAASMGVWELDLLENQLIWDDQVFRLYGLEKNEYSDARKTWEQEVYPEDQRRIDQETQLALRGEKEFDSEFRATCPDGSIRHIKTFGYVVKDANQQPLRMIGVNFDITDRKVAEEKLKKLLEDLTRSNQELEQFAYVASHDLQEPLRMVTSYMQLLSKRYKGKLDKDADEFIGYAVDGAVRMQRLINDLLAFSRIGTREQEFKPISCDVILGQAIDNLKVLIADANAKVTHDPLPVVMGDESQLLQVFQNLLNNAVKFHAEALPIIHVGVRQVGGPNEEAFWEFSVKDNGIGIDPQYFERVFVIFQRLHNKETYSGTGIGLAICKKIVERHGGRIWVESQPYQGSTLYFTIKVLE